MEVKFYTLVSSAYPNDIKYVGKTKQTLKRRLQGHLTQARRCLKLGIYTNHNYNWINQQLSRGYEIIIEEIETINCEDNETWKNTEKYWIAQFKEWGFYLNNISEGGEEGNTKPPIEEVIRKRAEHFIGKPRSEKTKQDISNSLKGLKKSEETLEKIRTSIVAKQGRPVLQFTLQNQFIREWDSGAEAARTLNIDKANLNACCKGKKKTCGGFIWKYKYPDIKPQTRVAQIDSKGDIIKIFNNSAEAGREFNIDKNLVNNVCQGKQSETYHLKFKYLD